jgi:TctA family transporter
MSTLRQEIIESEKARSDLLKWKLIGLAALGSAGLGLNQGTNGLRAYFLLPLIPLLCFYVDLLCRHLTLRILVIAAFLRRYATDDQKAYEDFVKAEARSATSNFFAFEDTALEWSTIVLSALLVGVGVVPQLLMQFTGTSELPVAEFRVFAIASGAGAIIFGVWFRYRFFQHRRALDAL